jgi:predicted nucleotide-binding protein (sugar kinase/HSP70/actin superfamily)
MTHLEQYAILSNEKAELEANLDAVKQKLSDIHSLALTELSQSSIQKVTLHGRTLYVDTKVFASIPKELKEKAIKMLKKTSIAGAIKVDIHPATLQSWVREHGGTIEEIQDKLGKVAEVIKLHEESKLVARKAN